MGALALLLGARELAFGAAHRRRARLAGRRLHPRHDRVRRARSSAQHFLAENPTRLVIDIDGLELSPQLRELVGKVQAPTTRTSPACASARTSRAWCAW